MPEGVRDPASLEKLHDIVVPDPVSWWPPAAGWYILGFLALVAAILLLVRAVLNWRNNRYRREALVELAEIRNASRDITQQPGAIARLAELLKRVALAAWPRETVAHLSGRPWIEFLNRTGQRKGLPEDSAEVLCRVAYSRKISEQLSPAQV